MLTNTATVRITAQMWSLERGVNIDLPFGRTAENAGPDGTRSRPASASGSVPRSEAEMGVRIGVGVVGGKTPPQNDADCPRHKYEYPRSVDGAVVTGCSSAHWMDRQSESKRHFDGES
jgi:hypothetical protein